MQMVKRLFILDEGEISPRLSHHFISLVILSEQRRCLLFARQFHKSALGERNNKTMPRDEHDFFVSIDDQNSNLIIFLELLSRNASELVEKSYNRGENHTII